MMAPLTIEELDPQVAHYLISTGQEDRLEEKMIRRFLTKIEVSDNGCWEWTASVSQSNYGAFSQGEKIRRAHIVSHEEFVGPVEKGMIVGHVCHDQDEDCAGGATCSHRLCVNPMHLRAMTQRENVQMGRGFNVRKTHCPSGHSYAEHGVSRTDKHGTTRRYCSACYLGKRDPKFVGIRKSRKTNQKEEA